MCTDNAAWKWNVEFPQLTYDTLNTRSAKKRANVIVSQSNGAEVKFSVPVAVGRKLCTLARNEPYSISSKEELRTKIDVLSRNMLHQLLETALNKRDYSYYELKEKFIRLGYSSSLVQEILSHAQEVGLIDDLRFARIFVQQKHASGWGPKKISLELRRRGIDSSIIDQACAAYGLEEDEFQTAWRICQHKVFHARDPYAQIVRFVCSKGFSPSVAYKVAKRLSSSDKDE